MGKHLERISLGKQPGFSLLEVMLATLILSFGLIGLARLNWLGMQMGREAFQHSHASVLINDLIERVQANRLAAIEGDYHAQPGRRLSVCEQASGCSAEQRAAHDLALWYERLTTHPLLPRASGTICRDSTPSDAQSAQSPNCDNRGQTLVVHLWWDHDLNPDTEPFHRSQVFIP